MTYKLTGKRKQVLEAICHFNDRSMFPNHHQIAVACGKSYCASDWAHTPLRELETVAYIHAIKRGLAGRQWKITDAGRSALNGLAFP